MIPIIKNYLSTGLYTYSILQYDIYILLKRYYPIVSLKTLGITADGRSIYCLKLGNPKGRKRILIDAGCHGREYMNSMLVMHQLRFFLETYRQDTLKDYEIYIIPMLNPDGVSISQFGAKSIHNLDVRNRVQAILDKNGIHHKYWKSNAMGVDINRNFSTSYWYNFNDTTYEPSYRFFKGYSPTSEVETATLQNVCTSIDGLQTVISYHSSGEEIYFDYGQVGSLMNDTLKILNILQSTTGYSKAESSLKGVGCSDWIVQKLKIPAFTIETGLKDCPLHIDEYAKVWHDNKNVISKLLRII
ncbi:MAG: hypothetical protein LUG94_03335 [Ruminococcus sp.]|nr:hypothetical protein [Ruminococcus sp.]